MGPGFPRQGRARRADEDSSAQPRTAGVGVGLLLAAWCLPGRREDMSVSGGVSQALLPVRNEVPSRLCLGVGGQGQGPWLCPTSASAQ